MLLPKSEGLFVTFEGLEGGGKTTAVERMGIQLRLDGLPVVQTKVLGGTEFAQKNSIQLWAIVHELLSSSYIGPDTLPDMFAELWFQSLASVTKEVIRPAIEAGSVVLCDRFSDSVLALIGYGGKREINDMQRYVQISTEGLVPHLTFFFDIPLEDGLKRKGHQYNPKTLAYYRDVERGYRDMFAQDHNKHWKRIDATQSIAQVDATIYQLLIEQILSKGIERKHRD